MKRYEIYSNLAKDVNGHFLQVPHRSYTLQQGYRKKVSKINFFSNWSVLMWMGPYCTVYPQPLHNAIWFWCQAKVFFTKAVFPLFQLFGGFYAEWKINSHWFRLLKKRKEMSVFFFSLSCWSLGALLPPCETLVLVIKTWEAPTLDQVNSPYSANRVGGAMDNTHCCGALEAELRTTGLDKQHEKVSVDTQQLIHVKSVMSRGKVQCCSDITVLKSAASSGRRSRVCLAEPLLYNAAPLWAPVTSYGSLT